MKKALEPILGILAGLIIGLPQGMGEQPAMMSKQAPFETLIVILVFGVLGGIVIGASLLSKSNTESYSLGGYFFFLVGVLSIGIPMILKNYSGDYLQSLNISSMFFVSAGLGMFIAGSVRFVFKCN